jgi:integrase
MSHGGEMPRADKRYLYKRNGGDTWWVKFRVPGTKKTIRKSLKTSNLKEAQERRDKLLEHRKLLLDQTSHAEQLTELRKHYLSSVDEDERRIIRDIAQDAAEDLAAEMGLTHIYKGMEVFDLDELSDEEQKPYKSYKTALGQLTPLNEVLPVWLQTIKNKGTRSDYRRGVEVLAQRFATLEEVDRRGVKRFLEWAKRQTMVSNATLRKWMSGYKSLWEFADKEKSIWNDQKLPSEEERDKKQAWSPEEVREMYRILSERNDRTSGWLKHVIWIAAHTGAREGAIAGLKYNPETQTIWFPKAKKEEGSRTIPAHSAIWANLSAWENGSRRTKSSICNRFSEFKQRLGHPETKDFHSFRRTFITMCENAGIPEGITADIAGHKKQTISYGLYSAGNSIEVMREALEKMRYE